MSGSGKNPFELFGDLPGRIGVQGNASLDAIAKYGEAERARAKDVIKNLRFGMGLHEERRLDEFWSARFDEYREQSLKHDLAVLFTADDLIRFLDASIVDKDSSVDKEEVHSVKDAVQVKKILVRYGLFKWEAEDFTWRQEDEKTWSSWLRKAEKDGRLSKGGKNEQPKAREQDLPTTKRKTTELQPSSKKQKKSHVAKD